MVVLGKVTVLRISLLQEGERVSSSFHLTTTNGIRLTVDDKGGTAGGGREPQVHSTPATPSMPLSRMKVPGRPPRDRYQ